MKKLVFLCLIILTTTLGYAKNTVHIAPLSKSVISTAVTVGTSATALPTTPLAGRNSISICNDDSSVTIYIGDSTVTTGQGFPVYAKTTQPFDFDDSIVLYAIVSSGTVDVRVIEAK